MLMYTALFFIGLIVGLYDSVVGSGGLVLVSGLTLLNIPPIMAVGTMRVLTLVQETVSLGAFLRKKLVEIEFSVIIGIFAACGSLIGARLIFNVPEKLLSYLIALMMVLLVVLMPLLKRKTKVNRPIYLLHQFYKNIKERDIKKAIINDKQEKLLILIILFFFLGLYGGFYGAGFGTLALLLFTIVGGNSLIVGAGNSRVVGFMMSLVASALFINKGIVVWSYFFPLAAGTVIGAWFGVELADKLGTKYIRVLLTIVILASAVKLVFATF